MGLMPGRWEEAWLHDLLSCWDESADAVTLQDWL